jgi:DNA topoisomerase-2
MNLFNSEDKLKKYESVEEIIDDYYEIRFEYYEDRKEYIINALEKDIIILSNKVKYIKEILDETIDLRKKKKQEIIDMLVEKKYYMIEDDKEFKYLVKMPMDSVSEENVEKMLNEHKEKANELERIKSTTIEEMWLSELEILENEYEEYQKERKQSQTGEVKVSNKKSITNKNTKVVKKLKMSPKELLLVEEEEEEIIIQPKKKSILRKI